MIRSYLSKKTKYVRQSSPFFFSKQVNHLLDRLHQSGLVSFQLAALALFSRAEPFPISTEVSWSFFFFGSDGFWTFSVSQVSIYELLFLILGINGHGIAFIAENTAGPPPLPFFNFNFISMQELVNHSFVFYTNVKSYFFVRVSMTIRILFFFLLSHQAFGKSR